MNQNYQEKEENEEKTENLEGKQEEERRVILN